MADDSSLLQECAESDAERIAMKRMPVFLFICALLLLSASPCFAQMYTVTDLGTFSPTVINSSGQVVGNLNGHGYLWTRTKGLQDLGLLTGGTFSTAVAINDLGMVAGTADGEGTERYFNGFPNVECSGLTQPFIWTQDGGMKGLGTYSVFYDVPCLVGLYTTGINALGTVVGYTRIYDTSQTGFVWTATGDFTFIRWSTDPPSSVNAINDTGQFVGQYGLSSMIYAFGYAAAQKNGVAMDLGSLACASPLSDPLAECFATRSSANDVSDLDQIVGWSDLPGQSNVVIFDHLFHAVFWTPGGEIRDLGT